MNFPIAIHKDKNSDYGVIVPDLPGCFSAGVSIEDALENSKEAILCHIDGLLSDGDPFPISQSIESYKKKGEFKDAMWGLVTIDLSEISGKAKRVNITVPERILTQLDTYANRIGETRSGLLVNAAIEYISHHIDD